MTAAVRTLAWLEARSDLLSPILVKEVRQIARAREFVGAFAASLLAGIVIAFVGAADALGGSTIAGRWCFVSLMSCLAVVGLAVIPLSAFSTLRNERLEQTLDLMMLTALSPRRVVLGKLLAQAVKLTTVFAGVAPFIAMSFLLGGIDLLTIVVSILALFLASLWMCALCLFLSTLLRSRALSGVVFGGMAIFGFLLFGISRSLFTLQRMGVMVYAPSSGGPGSAWWPLAIAVSFCLVSMTNLVLLAENRLSLPTANRVTPLRLGFLAQFLLIAGWTATYVYEPLPTRQNVAQVLGVIGGLHLSLVAMFTVTEDLSVAQPVLHRLRTSRWWHPALAMFRPGGGFGALYVMLQMALLFAVTWFLGATSPQFRWLITMCGYIAFFTGVPVVVARRLMPAWSALHIRATVLVFLGVAVVLPDVAYYLIWQPELVKLDYSARHLLNPLRTLANWTAVETNRWFGIPGVMGLAGVFTWFLLMLRGASAMRTEEAGAERSPATGEAAGRADVIY